MTISLEQRREAIERLERLVATYEQSAAVHDNWAPILTKDEQADLLADVNACRIAIDALSAHPEATPSERGDRKPLRDMSPTELARMEDKALYEAMRDAQKALEEGAPAGRYSWLDAPVAILKDRALSAHPTPVSGNKGVEPSSNVPESASPAAKAEECASVAAMLVRGSFTACWNSSAAHDLVLAAGFGEAAQFLASRLWQAADAIKGAYKQGWGDREDDLLVGVARVAPSAAGQSLSEASKDGSSQKDSTSPVSEGLEPGDLKWLKDQAKFIDPRFQAPAHALNHNARIDRILNALKERRRHG